MSGSEHLIQKKLGSEYGFSVKNAALMGMLLTLIPVVATGFGGVMGMGYFACAYLVYLAASLFSNLILPYCIARVSNNYVRKGQFQELWRYSGKMLITGVLIGWCLAALVFSTAEEFAYSVMWSGGSAVALKFMSLALLFLPAIGVLRGILQSIGGGKLLFLVSLGELVITLLSTGIGAKLLYEEGVKMDVIKGDDIYRYAYSGGGAALGVLIGTAVTFLVLLAFSLMILSGLKRKGKKALAKAKKSDVLVTIQLMIPLLIAGTVMMAIPMISQSTVGNYLRRNVMESTYISEWGIFVGAYLSLILFPVVLSVSMGMLNVPLVRKEVTNETRIGLVYAVRLAIKLSMMVGVPASFGMLFLSYPMLLTFYPALGDVSAPMVFLLSGFLLILFLTLAGITSMILVGMNRSYSLSFHAVFAFAGFLISCEVLMRVMNMGIYSALFGMLIFAILLSTWNILTIDRGLGTKQEWKKSYLVPLLASFLGGAGSVACEYAVLQVMPKGQAAFVLGLLVYVGVVFILYSLMRIIDEGEVYELPDGRRWYKRLRKIHFIR